MNRGLTILAGLMALTLLTSNAIVPASAAKSKVLQVSVAASSPVYAGQTVQISANVQFANGTAVGNKATFGGSRIFYPNGTSVNLPTTPTVTAPELVRWAYVLPSNSPNGLYSVVIRVNVAPNATWAMTSFTVNNQLASANGLASLGTQISSLSTQIASLSSRVNTLSVNFRGNFTNVLNALSADTSSIQNGIGRLSTSLGGNFSTVRSSLTQIQGKFGSLANSSSISDLKRSVATDIAGINAQFSGLATAAQANSINAAVQNVQTQLSGLSSFDQFILLAVVIAAALIIIVLFMRR